MSIVDELQSVYERIKAMPPVAVAFWCVDSPHAVWQIRNMVEKRQTIPNGGSILMAIPVYEWYSQFADEADRAKRPECFKAPGVYAEMNNGTWQKI